MALRRPTTTKKRATLNSDTHTQARYLLLIPSFYWDRKIIVPKDHELARQKRRITLEDLARFPLVTYVFSFGGQSLLKAVDRLTAQ